MSRLVVTDRATGRLRRLAQPALLPLLVVLACGAVALAIVAWPPGSLTVDVGQPGDRLFTRNFYGDEHAAGRSYRWSRGRSQLAVPGLGGAERLRVTAWVEGGRSDGRAVPLTLLIDGVAVGSQMVSAPTVVVVEGEHAGEDVAVVELRAPTVRPPGDARDLGVIVDRVAVEPLGARATPAWAVRLLILVGLAGLVSLVSWPLGRRRGPVLPLALGGSVVLIAALAARPWLLAGWPWLALGLTVAAVVVHHGALVAGLAGALRVVERPRVALAGTLLLALGHMVLLALLAGRIEHIGHADYADNAVVARNLVQGRGYTVDYAAQFYLDYPAEIRHPADVWPLLQPTLIAASFLLFGVTTFAAKLPSIAIMGGLLAATAWLGGRLFGRPAGLAAAVLLALDGFFFTNSLFPVNDVVFTLLALLVVGLVDLLSERELTGDRRLRLYGLLGACAGLLFVAKPSGALLAAGAAAWWLWQRRPGGRLPWPGWRPALLGAAVALLIAMPVFGRNMLTFGRPFFTTESYDAWVLKWEPPDENIYRLMGADLPHPRRLVGFGADRVSEAVALQFRRLGDDVAGGVLLETSLLLLAGLGLILGGAGVRRQYTGLLWAVLPYSLFVLIYWHYEQRYFAFLTPWALVLAVGAAWRLLRETLAWPGGARSLAIWGVALGLTLLIWSRVESLTDWADKQISPARDVLVSRWLTANTPPDAVIMTRVPWELSWHSERRSVMIPLGSAEEIFGIMRRYGVDYLYLEQPNSTARRRAALLPLYEGRDAFGMTKVFELKNDRGEPVAYLYRVPERIGETR